MAGTSVTARIGGRAYEVPVTRLPDIQAVLLTGRRRSPNVTWIDRELYPALLAAVFGDDVDAAIEGVDIDELDELLATLIEELRVVAGGRSSRFDS